VAGFKARWATKQQGDQQDNDQRDDDQQRDDNALDGESRLARMREWR
jgi:hypothetical protein